MADSARAHHKARPEDGLHELLGQPAIGSGIWRGRQRPADLPVLSTGYPRLDALLPGGGWPLGALTEILGEHAGLGELRLLLPLLARLTPVANRRQAAPRGAGWAILVDPPWTPYPHSLHGHGVDLRRLLMVRTPDAKQSLWACEQALRGVRGGTVLAWLQQRRQAGFTHLRRLQLAARAGRKSAFVFRSATAAGQSTPATLRLHLAAEGPNLKITLLKGRGAPPGRSITLPQAGASLPALPESPPPATHAVPPAAPRPGPRDRSVRPVEGAGP
jgi:hypothetical protein